MKKTAGKNRLPQMSLILRVCCGVYLLYQGWSLRGEAFTGDRGLFFGGAVIVFALCGTALSVLSVRSLARGEFRRPYESDQGDNQNTASEEGEI